MCSSTDENVSEIDGERTIMIVAFDSEKNRIYAADATKETQAFCPDCGELLKLRRGERNKAHFAHQKDSLCHYGEDRDNKSEWHIRMQDFFPREYQEVFFRDDEKNESHRADVFIPEANTVLEFQRSSITEEEFLSRTLFHANNGRRIVWLFDESSTGNTSTLGKFRLDEELFLAESQMYQWMWRPRKFLHRIYLKQNYDRYSVCVYTGTDGDAFRRIVDQEYNFSYVRFSSKLIHMESGMNVDQFFEYDQYWIDHDNAEKERHIAEAQRKAQQQEYERHMANMAFQNPRRYPRRHRF